MDEDAGVSRERLEAVYRQHRQGLYTLALSITRQPETAEDAVHDAFSRLFGRPALPEDLVPYIFASVRNAARDARDRKPAGTLPPEASVFDGASRDPSASAERSEASARAREALESLAEEERETIVMKLYADLTLDQIANALNAPLPTVASRYRRGLQRIRKTLDEA